MVSRQVQLSEGSWEACWRPFHTAEIRLQAEASAVARQSSSVDDGVMPRPAAALQ